MLAILNQGQVEPVLKRIAATTQPLLRDALNLDDAGWQEPSMLPGWSRAHVATHLARNADAQRRVIAAALAGDAEPLYPSAEAKFNDLERGSERAGMELYVDLDTSATELGNLYDRVEDWLVPIRIGNSEFPMAVLPLIRLNELAMHHLDLLTGFEAAELEPVPARWLLQWMLLLLDGDPTLPAVDVVSDSGVTASLGGVGERITTTGPDAALWGWLTGRTDGDGVVGTGDIAWPLAG